VDTTAGSTSSVSSTYIGYTDFDKVFEKYSESYIFRMEKDFYEYF
jgi:hypothetical protein